MNMRQNNNPFNIMNNRAMVSLGPLNKNKYCPYSCAFCYVQDGFLKYRSLSIDDICSFLEKNKEQFEIIYISGDTDSFAEPRTKQGLELLSCISEKFDKDILFTTRMVFDECEMKRISTINYKLQEKGKNLFGCISITSPTEERIIEPEPIKTIEERISQLESLHKNNIFSILAMRPFLPIYTTEQYKDLVLKVRGKVNCILGERWFFHEDDVIYNRVMQGKKIDKGKISLTEMDFDDNSSMWHLWYDEQLEYDIEQLCRQLEIPFYMRSMYAVKYLKSTANTKSNL